jgi:hypothetical protein
MIQSEGPFIQRTFLEVFAFRPVRICSEKATFIFDMPVRPSVRVYQGAASIGRICVEFDIVDFFGNL